MSERPDPELLRAELRLRRDRAEQPLDKAIWCLVLGEPDEGLEVLRRYVDAPREDPKAAERRALLAVVVGDWKAATDEARSALGEPLSYVPGYLEYVTSVLCLIAGDEDEARANVERFDKVATGRDRLRSGHPSRVVEIPRGLLERDADCVAAGVEALLAWHLRRARARSDIFNSSRAVISLEAVIALLLAHRRDLIIPVAPKYRAASLPLLAVYLSEWEGQPLPRGVRLDLEADLVAGSWLRSQGLAVDEPPPSTKARRPARRRTRGPVDAGEDFVRQSLRLREQAGEGSAWQLASWALILGHPERARAHLSKEAAAARTRWRESAPPESRGLRWLWRSQAFPNQNFVREHFALALVLGDEEGLGETIPLLREWADAVEEDRQRRGQPPYAEGRYGHAEGYLDLLANLLAGASPAREEAQRAGGPLPSTRVACAALADRDPALLATGLDGMLSEYVQPLERKTSPPPPVCVPAVHVAAGARRLGIPVEVDERYAAHPVPIEIRNLPGHEGRLGRLPCDLLARAVWDS